MVKSSVAEVARRLLLSKGSFSSGELARAAGISRQAIHRHIRAMLGAGSIVRQGGGRSARYLPPARTFHRRLRREGLSEGDVWDEVRSSLPDLSELKFAKAKAVLAYAFTEMLNNAIDHSGSSKVEVFFEIVRETARFTVVDEGIGVYENVRAQFKLDTVLAALQEISKGKVTTQQDRHTGEGIFFTSKVADSFQLEANGLRWNVDNRREDVAISDVPEKRGTTVRFELLLTTTKTMDELFAQYSQEAFQFDTSRIVVKLFERGADFVSRSEAKRVVAGLERFRHVIVDFQGIDSVGQGFADEIFRVWAKANPDIRVEAINMRAPVKLMVERSLGEAIRPMDFPLGWTESTVRKVLDDSDASTRVRIPSDPDGNIVVATRRNLRASAWSYLGIVVAAGESSRPRLVSAFILLRQHVSEDLWKDPVAALKTFVELYGRALACQRSSEALAPTDPGKRRDECRTRLEIRRPGHPLEATRRHKAWQCPGPSRQ